MSAPIRELRPQALPAFMALLQEVLEERGSITLRAVKQFRADGLPATRISEVAFGTGRVSMLRGLSPERFVDALTHEFVHLQRGPALVNEVDAEEVVVEDEAQTLLYGSPRPVTVRTENRRRRHLSVVR